MPAWGQRPEPELQTVEAARPTQAEIAAALDVVRADPDIAPVRTVRTLRWSGGERPAERTQTPGWLAWIAELFGWFARSSRALLWVAAGLLAALLVLYVVRLLRARGAPRASGRFVAPSHVGDLDIRPESLPDDVGAAARSLWDRGEHRAALALLYRGLLSRLVHVHAVPIRDSSTEGDCLALAARRLDEERRTFASRLVHVWQVAVYGGEDPETADVHALCGGFAAALERKPDRRRGPAGTAGRSPA